MIFLLFTVGWGFFVGCATKGFEGECRECDVGKATDEWYNLASGKAYLQEPSTMKRLALVIGNGSYINMSSLNAALNDAKEIAEILRLKDFEVELLENLDFNLFLKAAQKFENAVNGGIDIVFFYYAGHAMQLFDSNYLLPIDIPYDKDLPSFEVLEKDAIYLGDFVRAMKKTNGKKIIILDSCRNHYLWGNDFIESRLLNQGLHEIESERNMIICYSTQPGNTAKEGIDGSSHGIYTGELINNLKKYGLDFKDVITRTRNAVLKKTTSNQIPWDSNSIMEGFSIDHIDFFGKLIHEEFVLSNGIDTICGSLNNLFLGSRNKLKFLQVNYGFRRSLSLKLKDGEHINDAFFIKEDLMLAISEKGFLYEFNLKNASENNYCEILFDSSRINCGAFYSLCFDEKDNIIYIGCENGSVVSLCLYDYSYEVHNISDDPIISLCINIQTSTVYCCDANYFYKINNDNEDHAIQQGLINTRYISYDKNLGLILILQKNLISTTKDNSFIKIDGLYGNKLSIMSFHVFQGRYFIIGTDAPSIMIYDLRLCEVVAHKFIESSASFPSAIFDLSIICDRYLVCRSKANHFGIWKIMYDSDSFE